MNKKEINSSSIININLHDDFAEIKYNPNIYSLDVLFNAAYILTDNAYIIIDGDPKNELIVKIKPKQFLSIDSNQIKTELKNLCEKFNDQALNYSVYKKQSERAKVLREEMLKRALLTNIMPLNEKTTHKNIDDEDHTQDKEEILIPWEEKYGNKK